MSSSLTPAAEPFNNAIPTNHGVHWTTWWAVVVGLAIILPVEYGRMREAMASEAGGMEWLTSINLDTTPYFFAFLMLPLAWFLRTRGRWERRTTRALLHAWFGANTKPGEHTSGVERVRAFG
jgi:hypothetical protein